MRRRDLLGFLTVAGGWPVASVAAGADATAASPAASPAAAPPPGPLPSERVVGIGGVFFRATHPDALAEWYRTRLGVLPVPTAYGRPSWQTEAGTTAFEPFSLATSYLGDRRQQWMINFRVRDLDAMAAQLRAAGETVAVDPERYPNGRFARLHDPDGNPIELWQPAATHGAE